MDLLTRLILVGMLLTFVENTTVMVVALMIYRKQQRANSEMEDEIKRAIDEVKVYIESPEILGNLKKEILKSLKGWLGGTKSGASRTLRGTAKELGGAVDLARELRGCESPWEKAAVLGSYGLSKLSEFEDEKKSQTQGEASPPGVGEQVEIKSVEAYQQANMSPEEYARAYQEGLKVVQAGTEEAP